MPTFTYTAVQSDGKEVRGHTDADDIDAAFADLAERALQPLKVREKKSILQFEITKKKARRKDLMHLCRQLGVFVRAGVPVLEAIEVLGEEAESKVIRACLADMSRELRGGMTMGDAVASHPEVFPPFAVEIIRTADMTGRLDDVLLQLAEYIEREIDSRRKVVAAMTYPCIVLAMAVGTVVILTTFVLPRFETLFQSLGVKLPLVTRILLSFTSFVSDYGAFIGAGLVVTGLGLFLGGRTRRGRAARDAFILKIPGFGKVVETAVLERFCRILGSMVVAGVTIPDALEVTGTTTNNMVFRRGIARAREGLMRGEGLAGPLAETKLFPVAARQMFRVGEDTGTLDEQLQTAADYFERELEYKIKKLTNMLEPAVILFVGLVVGFVAVALVSAMYGVFNQVQV